LDGLSLTPGVYDGGALALADTGQLTLAGSAESVWVFRAASSLTIGSGTRIVITGGASSCNVFWQVGSSATIGSAAQFQGTIV
ncbi:ice-binding family protein, partial [Acinetobacter baumannii]